MTNHDDNKPVDRRRFFRWSAYTVLGSSFALLFTRAYQSGDCFGHSQCKVCTRNNKCELPLAVDYRANAQDNFLDQEKNNNS